MPVQQPREPRGRTPGQIVKIETTKTAKARYRRSAGQQWTPTRGQVNAAELWNKQEEQLRKGREREERRKKEALRQAEKDAQLREAQDDMLRKGKITIEDTWGKVNASQNRLHKFFGPPRVQSGSSGFTNHGHRDFERSEGNPSNSEAKPANGEPLSEVRYEPLEPYTKTTSKEATISDADVLPEQENSVIPSKQCSSSTQVDDSDRVATDLKRKRDGESGEVLSSCRSRSTEASNEMLDEFFSAMPDSLSQYDHELSPNLSQRLMPPPPKPTTLTNRSTNAAQPTEESKVVFQQNREIAHTRSSSSPIRSPLTEMNESQLNSRSNRVPDISKSAADKHVSYEMPPISTQVLANTIYGLSSQDLLDDLEDNKENSPPSARSSQSTAKTQSCCEGNSPLLLRCSRLNANANRPHEDEVSAPLPVSNKLRDYDDDFDKSSDFDLDDELLMSLAATQQLKKNLYQTVHCNIKDRSSLLAGHNILGFNELSAHQNQSGVPTLPVGDSFTFSGVDEDDLLECVQTFEDEDEDKDKDEDEDEDDVVVDAIMLSAVHEFEQAQGIPHMTPHAKRTSLPWVRYPIATNDTEPGDLVSRQAKSLNR